MTLTDGLVAPMLPPHWPTPLKAQQELVEVASGHVKVGCVKSVFVNDTSRDVSTDELPKLVGNCLTDPSSSMNFGFAVMSMLVLLHDFCVIPFAVAWQLPFEGYLQACSFFSASFWTLDIILSFFRGFYSDEQLILQWRQVSWQYLKTYFLSDSAVTICDWLSLILVYVSDTQGAGRGLEFLRYSKLARFLRMAGAFRMLRVLRKLQDVFDRHTSDSWQWVVSIASLLGAAVLFTHLIACAWMAIGRFASSDTDARWTDFTIRRADGEDERIADAELLYQYGVSYHWAISVLTQGNIEIPCTNAFERLFNSACLMAGFLLGSMFISNLSAKMVEYQTLHRDRLQQLRRLRRYLDDNHVVPGLSVMALRQATQRVKAHKPLTPKDLPVLDALSSTLRKEIRSSICKPQLLQHKLFRVCGNINGAWLDGFCREAVEINFVTDSDELFSPGTTANAAYMLISGHMQYCQSPESSPVPEPRVKEVKAGAWLSESALWSQWIHVGTVEAAEHCRLVTLRVSTTIDFLQRHHTICTISKAYCIEFHRRIVAAKPPLADWPDDLGVPATSFEDMLMSMPLVVGMIIGFQAVDHILSSATREGVFFGLSTSHIAKLEGEGQKLKDEIQEGKCALYVDEADKAVRITTLLLLRIPNEEGNFFWQLGKLDDTQLSAKAGMPAAKCYRGESAPEAVDRLLGAQFAPLAGCCVEGSGRDVVEAVSREYGVHTKYLRTICDVRLLGPIEAPSCTLRHSLMYGWRSTGSGMKATGRRPPTLDVHLEAFADRPVYAFYYEGVARLYAWLSAPEIEYFGTSTGEQALAVWLAGLRLPPEEGGEFDMTL